MKTNVAFFGAGEQARPYLDALARRSDVQLVGVCDPIHRAAEVVAAGWGAQVFMACETMLSDACPDALWVCVPSSEHGEVLLRAARQRIPFFVDPPGASNHDQARECGKLVYEGRLVSAVGFPTAYADVAREAREYLGGNTLPLALGWWLKPARESPDPSAIQLLWNEACVLVDALRYFSGEVKRVHAFPAGNAPAATAGGLVVHLEFVSGTTAVLTLATFPRPEPRVELELSGEGWSLAFNEGLSNLRVAEQDKTTILRCLNRPVEEQVNTFLEAIATGEPESVPTSYVDALATLTVCQAAIMSAVEGRPVEIATLLEV
jgi:predicted dehydrogenase